MSLDQYHTGYILVVVSRQDHAFKLMQDKFTTYDQARLSLSLARSMAQDLKITIVSLRIYGINKDNNALTPLDAIYL